MDILSNSVILIIGAFALVATITIPYVLLYFSDTDYYTRKYIEIYWIPKSEISISYIFIISFVVLFFIFLEIIQKYSNIFHCITIFMSVIILILSAFRFISYNSLIKFKSKFRDEKFKSLFEDLYSSYKNKYKKKKNNIKIISKNIRNIYILFEYMFNDIEKDLEMSCNVDISKNIAAIVEAISSIDEEYYSLFEKLEFDKKGIVRVLKKVLEVSPCDRNQILKLEKAFDIKVID